MAKSVYPPAVMNYVDERVRNAVVHLDQSRWGPSRNQLSHFYASRGAFLLRHLSNFLYGDVVAKFQRRITALEWHPKLPYLVTAACKGGGIAVGTGHRAEQGKIRFDVHKVQDGIGPGGAVFSIKYNVEETDWLYTASLDGKLSRLNFLDPEKPCFTYYDTGDYHTWFTSMDVSYHNKVLLAGTNKGFAHVYHLDGDKSTVVKLHESKIHYCEFNKTIPYLVATASLDPKATVCLWDLRNLKPDKTIFKYNGDCIENEENTVSSGNNKPKRVHRGANVATFSLTDGSRLLMNDQQDKIKVFQAPLWQETLRIKHHHRQFQHLTAIQAAWHPLHDIIVIGRYPIDGSDGATVKGVPLRPIDFFDGKTGCNIHRLYHPSNGIISLNQFNPTGEVLASCMGNNLLFWQASPHLEVLEGQDKTRMDTKSHLSNLPMSMRNALRGRGVKTAASDNDDDSDDFDEPKKKRQKKTGSVKSKAGTSAGSTTLQMGDTKTKPKSKCPATAGTSQKGTSSSRNSKNSVLNAKDLTTVSVSPPSSSNSKFQPRKSAAKKTASEGSGSTNQETLSVENTMSRAQRKGKKPLAAAATDKSDPEELSTQNKGSRTVRTKVCTPPPPSKRGRGKGHK